MNWLLAAALVFLGVAAPATGYAATGKASFTGTVIPVGGSIGNPGQVALDHQGNLWAVSILNNSVVEWNGTSWTTVISGLSSPYGLAFDSSNNLYVSQTGVPGVYEYIGPGYSTGTKLAPSFNSPVYLAFDARNNLFVADSGNNAVYELLASSTYATATAVVSGLTAPRGVALDANGNLYITDGSISPIKRYTASSSYATMTALGSSSSLPPLRGVAVDPGGNVYVSEFQNGKLDLISAYAAYNYGFVTTIYTNPSASGSQGIVVGPGGTLYQGDSGGGLVYQLSPGAVNMGTSAVGSAASAVTVTFDFLGNWTGVHTNVGTTGEAAHDFTITNGNPGTCGGTAASNSFNNGQTCTVIVNYAATAPGLRTGAVKLLSGTGSILATGFVYGTGTAPVAAFSPASVSPVLMGSLSPALTAPANPAWRVDGNLFFTDGSSPGRVLEIAPGSGSPTVVSTGSYTIQQPEGVAIDGAGNIFVSDAGNDRVLDISAAGTTSIAIPASYGMSSVGQVAVDPSGAAYVADGGNARIVVAPPIGNVYTLPITGVALSKPAGVAVDSNYNVYIADSTANRIDKVTDGIATTLDTSSLTPSLSSPSSLTIDANGTLYVSDTGNNRMVLIPVSGPPTVLAYDYATALSSPNGVAFDLTGQIYIADSGNNSIMQYDWTSAGYGFATTAVGSVSSDSPANFFFFNLGNSPLSIAIPTSGNNPSITNSAFSLGAGTNCPELTASSSTPGTLNSLAGCTLSFNFQPTSAGSSFDEVSYFNDSLNVAGTSSVVALYGTGTAAGDTTSVAFASLPTSLYSTQSATVSVTVADITTPASVPTGSVSFTDSVQGSLGTATINGSGVAALGSIMFIGTGTHVITAAYAGAGGVFAASSQTASIAVTQAPVATVATPQIAVDLGQVPVGQTSSAATVTFTLATTGVLGRTQIFSLGAYGKGHPFRGLGSSSCIPMTLGQIYTSGSTCTVVASFSPNYPGVQFGAVEILDGSSNVLATAYIYATGTGPETATLPGTVTSVPLTGLNPVPYATAFDGNGTIYFTDYTHSEVYRVSGGGGTPTPIAGTGTAGFSGDGGAATSAAVNSPYDVAVDGAGNLYISDYGNNRVRMVSAATGTITTYAGTGATGLTGDGGPATSATLNSPTGLALDGAGNLYIADQNNSVIRKVAAATGVITTVAGTGTTGYSGDGALATQAQLSHPNGVVLDGDGNLYIADQSNNRIRAVSASTGNILTVAGNGGSTDSGNGGPATQAGLSGPLAVAVDAAGNLTVLEGGGVIRVVLAASGVIESDPVGVGVPVSLREDGAGDLYTADTSVGSLYIVSPATSLTYPTITAVGSTDTADGAKTALVLNTGNTVLTAVAPGLTVPGDFAQVSGSGTPADCTPSFSLAAGAACALSLAFEPTAAGVISESFVLTDNSLNYSPSTQNIGVAGTALTAQSVLSVTGVPITAQGFGTTFTVGSLGGSGTGAVTFSASGACSVSGNTVTITAPTGTCSVTASKASDGTYAAATSALATVAATLGIQAALIVTGVPITAQTYGSTFTVGATGGTGTGAVTFNASGACSVTGTTVTITSGSGSCSVTATKASDGNYTAAISPAATVAASLAAQTALAVTGVPAAAQTYGSTFTVGSSGGSGTGAVTFSASGACSVTGSTVTITSGSGSCSVTATKASDGNYTAATSPAATVAASLAAQTALTVTGVPTTAQTYGSTFTVGSSGGSGTGVVTFNASGACSVTGATVTMTSGSGSCSVTATKASEGNYTAATSPAATVAASLAAQAALAVTGVPTAAQPYGSTFTVGSIGGSGTGVVTFNASGACSVTGSTVTITGGSGNCSVTATKASDGNYTAATSPAATVAASLAAQTTLTVTGVPTTAQTYGSTFTVGSIGGSGTGAVSFNASGACLVTGTTVTITGGSGNCSVTATKASDGNYTAATSLAATVAASMAAQTTTLAVTGVPTAAQTYGSTFTVGSIGGSGTGAVTFNATGACSVTGAMVTMTSGSGNCSVTTTKASDGNYALQTSAAVIVAAARVSQTINFTALPAVIGYPSSPIALSATGGPSALPIVFSVISGPASVSGSTLTLTSTGTVVVAANESGNSDYAPAAQVTQSLLSLGVTLGANVSGLSFGTETLGVTSAAQTVIVNNPYSIAISLTSVIASGDFAATSNCPAIPAGGNCSIGVTFTPTASGSRTGALTLVNVDSETPLIVTLTGVGGAAGIATAPASLTFGSQVLGTTSTGLALGIENTGTLPLAISNVATTGDFAATGNCATIPAGTNCTLTVTFIPSATGTRTGTVTLTDNPGGGSSTETIQLSGSGTEAGAALSTSAETFPSTLVGTTSATLTATLTNTGTSALTGIVVAVLGDFGQSNTCGTTLAAGASCNLSISYTPTIAGGETGALNISDNLGTQSIILAGTGLTPGASLNAAQSLLFGGQLVGATSQAQTVVFTNTGSEPETFSSIVLPANFTDTTNCSGTIPAGASCSINVFFTPSTPGAQSGLLTLTDTTGTQTVSLAGVGVGAVLSITPSFVLFGSQQGGTVSQAQSLQVTNTSSNAVTLGALAVTNSFVESDKCSGVTLAGGESCAVAVGFAPSATGTISGSLAVASADNTVSTVAALQGQGAGAGISIQPSLVSFGSETVGVASGAQIVTVWNTGLTAFSIGAVIASGDFSESDTCSGKTIAAGTNCVLSVTVTPTTQGTRTGTIQFVESIDGLQIVSLSGVGQAPGIGLSTNALAFGSLPIVAPSQAATASGTSQSVVITNAGEGVLDLASIQTVGDFRETDTCGGPVAAGSTCNVDVIFVPTALGHRTGTLTLNSNAGGQQVVSLAGDGSPIGLTLTPPILNFGLQTEGIASAPLTAILSNNTGQAITQLTLSASGEYSETDNCGPTLANASTCTLQVKVLPTTTGAITGTISVSSAGVVLLGALQIGHKNTQYSADTPAHAMAESASAGNSNANIGTVATQSTTVPSAARVAGLAFGDPPASSITAGGNAGPSITVIEEDANGNTVSAVDSITLTVTGPAGYSKSYISAAAGGTAIFNLGSAALTTSGVYTYSAAIATNAGVTAAISQEAVATGVAAALSANSGSGQTAAIDLAFALPLTVRVVDGYGNPVSGAIVTFNLPASGAGAALSAASAVTNSSGNASVTATANGTAGSYTITAAVGSIAPVVFSLTNSKALATLTLAAGINPVLSGTAVSFSAVVSSADGSPSGSVTFLDGTTSLGSAALVSGTASITVAGLADGSHSVTAVYSGDASFVSITSSAVSEFVLDFTLTSNPTASPSLSLGQSVTYALTIQPNQGNSLPPATILTIAGLPANAAASLTLSPWIQETSTSWQLPAGTPYVPIPLVITTSAATTAASHRTLADDWPRLAWGLLLPFALLQRRARGTLRAAGRWVGLFAVAFAVSALSGCGVGHGFFAQPPQTYTLTVTATVGTVYPFNQRNAHG